MEPFSALLIICEGNPTVAGGFPSQRAVTCVVRGMQTYAECCAEGFISIRSTEQVQVNYKDKDTKTTFKTHS